MYCELSVGQMLLLLRLRLVRVVIEGRPRKQAVLLIIVRYEALFR
jgi:hypothetical protein